MKVFLFDNSVNEIVVNEPEILLIKEFEKLWDANRNITKTDKTGKLRTKAYRELVYIWLMLDWASPYSDYSEQERHEACLIDAKLSEEEWNDPIFRAACRKYRELQESSRSLKLIKSAQSVVDKVIDYFENVDLQERDPITQKPIYKTNDVMKEMGNVSVLIEQLKTLEFMYKKEMEEDSNGVRGDVEIGFMDK